MGSLLLLGAGSSSSGGGESGPTLDADFEYQKITPSDFVGKITLGLLGDTHEVDATSGALTAGEMQTELESLVGAGNVEVSIYSGAYYVVKFIEDLAEYNLAQMSIESSATYVPNDGAGTSPSKTSQRDYVAAVNEVVTINLVPGGAFDAAQTDTAGNSVNWTEGTTTFSASPGMGWSVTSGSATDTVVFTADTPGPKNVSSVLSPSNSSGTPVTVNTTGVTEIIAQVVVNLGNGATGWVRYEASDLTGGSVAFSKALSAAEIDAILTDAGYPAVTVTKDGSTLTIDHETIAASFATVTISGHTGVAVTPSVATLQNGTTPTAPTFTSSATFNVTESNTSVGTVTVSGGLAPMTYSISGTDSSLFTINASTGVLAFLVAPDFESPGDSGANNVYNITVRAASINADYTEQSVAVTVVDLFDTPLIQWPLAGIDTSQTGSAIGLTLTNNNTVQNGNGDGVYAPAGIGGSCAKFAAATDESFSVADAADLTIGSGSMTRYGWVRLISTGAIRSVFSKDNASTQREEGLYYDNASSRWLYYIFRNSDSTAFSVEASTFGAVPTGTWMFVQTQVNPTTGLIRIRVNKGAWNSTSYGVGQAVKDTTATFYLGGLSYGGGSLEGYMAKWRCDKSIISDAELDAIYDDEVS
jgi:hypothetical protein